MDRVIVALPIEDGVVPPDAIPNDARVHTVVGGPTRQASVFACLQGSLASPDDLVVVHDGARPAVHPDDVRAVCEAARGLGGAVLGRRLTDTVKKTREGRIERTLDRETLFRAETPQVFRRELLERAVAAALRDGFEGTDESSLVERLDGVTIAAVEAVHPNPKLTVPADWPWIAGLLAS